MHLPDGLLDPKISAGFSGIAAAVLGVGFAKTLNALTVFCPAKALAVVGNAGNTFAGKMRRVLTASGRRTIQQIGMVAALIFIMQMIDFPLVGGTSGHLLGAVLAVVVLGPWAGLLALASVLIVQACFFADGGIFTLGVNIFNLGIVGGLGGFVVYAAFKRIFPEWFAIFVAAGLSVVTAGIFYAIMVGMIIPDMAKVFLSLGLAEGIATPALVALCGLSEKIGIGK